MAAERFYKIVVKDSAGNITEAWAKGKKSPEDIKQIFIQQQKLGNMPVGEIVSMELSSNPKMPSGTVTTTITDKEGKITTKEVPVVNFLGLNKKPKP